MRSDFTFYGALRRPLWRRALGPLFAIGLGFVAAVFVWNCGAVRCFVWSLTQ